MTDHHHPQAPRVSLIIKALNEAGRIERCLEVAEREARQVGGEIILVDSLSTDSTVELASRFDVRIVQFLRREDTGCGAAVQLGYQYARGEFIYVLDADMVLEPGFLTLALNRLSQDPNLAGVGGKLIDTQVNTMADKRRVGQAKSLLAEHYVGELGGGGLYRRSAIESVGYLANRWLHAYEEADLGVRLRSKGWRLLKLIDAAVTHEGHSETNWQMFARLWRNGRAAATGVFIRSSLFRPWFWMVVRKLAHVYAVPIMQLGQVVPILLAPSGWKLLSWLGYWLVLFGVLALKKRSTALAAWSLTSWHYLAVASVSGLFNRNLDPTTLIAAREIAVTTVGCADRDPRLEY